VPAIRWTQSGVWDLGLVQVSAQSSHISKFQNHWCGVASVCSGCMMCDLFTLHGEPFVSRAIPNCAGVLAFPTLGSAGGGCVSCFKRLAGQGISCEAHLWTWRT